MGGIHDSVVDMAGRKPVGAHRPPDQAVVFFWYGTVITKTSRLEMLWVLTVCSLPLAVTRSTTTAGVFVTHASSAVQRIADTSAVPRSRR